jgi:hypothetical protein
LLLYLSLLLSHILSIPTPFLFFQTFFSLSLSSLSHLLSTSLPNLFRKRSFLILLIPAMSSFQIVCAMVVRFNTMNSRVFHFFIILSMAIIRFCRSGGIQTVSGGVCPWPLRCHSCQVLRTIERMSLLYENEVNPLHHDGRELKMRRTPQKLDAPLNQIHSCV